MDMPVLPITNKWHHLDSCTIGEAFFYCVPPAIFEFFKKEVLCHLVEHLSDPVNVVANGGADFLLIVQKVNRIEQVKVFDFTEDIKDLVIVDILANKSQVYVRARTICPL